MAKVLNDTDRQEWARLGATQEFLRHLRASRQEAMESWAKERFVRETGDLTLQANAKALGGVDALTQAIEYIESFMLQEDAAIERLV